MQPRSLARICDDFRSTTGRSLTLDMQPQPDFGAGWSAVSIRIDGHFVGELSLELPSEEEAAIAELVWTMCDQWLDEEIWGGWPMCPDHPNHPLDPRVGDDAMATWFCPRGRAVATIGHLTGGDT